MLSQLEILSWIWTRERAGISRSMVQISILWIICEPLLLLERCRQNSWPDHRTDFPECEELNQAKLRFLFHVYVATPQEEQPGEEGGHGRT